MFINYSRVNFAIDRSHNRRSGWTVIVTMLMILFLMILGFAMIQVFTNESKSAANYVESTVAHYLAEAGIEHAMYVLQNNANDFVNDPANQGWNKLFATKNEFNFDIPFTDARDKITPGCPELNKPLDTEVASKVINGAVLSINIAYKLSEEIDPLHKVGRLTITSVAKYRNIRRKVEVEKEIFLFKDIPIQFDHVLYVNNLMHESIPGRRDKGNSGFWRKVANFVNGRYVPQQFFVNGLKVFLRDFTIPLNKDKDPTWVGAFETGQSMMDKLSKKNVDFNVANTKLDNYNGIVSSVTEIDSGILGGSRGNTDLTGFDPAGVLRKFFTSIGLKDKKDRKPNELYGDIKRAYKYKDALYEEPYITPGSDGDKNSWYHGAVDVKPDLKAKYPEDKIIGLLEPAMYKRVSQKQFVASDHVTYLIGKKEQTQVVKKYRGWGPWQAAPPSKGLLGPIKDIFAIKTGKQAALANPAFAIQLRGYEFVDGDVHIEGYYQGRGTIIATGNIYVGNELLRHTDDRSGIPNTYKYPDGYAAEARHEGAYNGIQLIALGTRPSPTGGETGKIIMRTTKDPSFAEENVLKSLFTNKDHHINIEAFLYAKNGIKSEFGDDSWFGNDVNKMATIVKGNLVSEKLGVTDVSQSLPDELSLLEDRVWTTIYEDLAKSQDKIVVAITPKISSYTQSVE